jgi:class 3 adenylate cyclase
MGDRQPEMERGPRANRFGRGAWAPGSGGIGYGRRHLGFLAGVLLAAVAIGTAYRYLFDPLDSRTSANYVRSGLHALGLACCGWLAYLMFDAAPRSPVAGALRRLPLTAEFAIKALAMTAVLTIVAVGLEFALYPVPPRRWFGQGLPLIVGIAFAVSLVTGAIFELRRLVGGPTLGSLLLGTYHRPRREQRIVMFLDIESSTALAERMGELRVHDLITDFFFDIDRAITEQGGEVHAYVGDAVIVTWRLSTSPERNARALRCFFAAADRMAALTPAYAGKFGVAPRFRAGIHSGAVVVSECGDMKRQIALFGDAMNVAARLCEHCKTTKQDLLVSADLLRAAVLPPGLTAGAGASITLRGRQAPIDAHPVRRTAAAGQC